MKQFILLPLTIGILQVTNHSSIGKNILSPASFSDAPVKEEGFTIGTQVEQGNTRMSAAVFKAQDYCRAELKDFDFDAHFIIVSAVVYFTGANFKGMSKGTISSSSLKPIKSLMQQCMPGSIVIFDEVKVMGPDKTIRTIQGLSLVLY